MTPFFSYFMIKVFILLIYKSIASHRLALLAMFLSETDLKNVRCKYAMYPFIYGGKCVVRQMFFDCQRGNLA